MLEEIRKRQSIRQFQSTSISKEKIEELLKAAMNAPTARNEQSWRFVVITNREKLDQLAKLSPYMSMMKSAPCAILVCGDKTLVSKEEYLYYDGAAAIENLLIEAVHQGLGACWCAIAPNPDRIENFVKAFGLTENLLPLSAVAIGKSKEEKELIDRYDPSKVTTIE